MLSARDLAAMQAEVELILDQTATLRRNTPVTGRHLGKNDGWANAGTVACHVLPGSGAEVTEAGRSAAKSLWTILLPLGTGITARDRLVIGSKTYEILSLDDGSSYPLQLAATCRRLD